MSLTQLFNDAFGIKFEKDDRQAWLKERMAGKGVRRQLTDVIQEYLMARGIGNKDAGPMYAKYTNQVYMGVFHKTAAQMKQERGAKELRDSLSDKELHAVQRIEEHAGHLIDKGLDPGIAIEAALNFWKK